MVVAAAGESIRLKKLKKHSKKLVKRLDSAG